MAGYLRVIIMPLARRKRAAVECRKCVINPSAPLRHGAKSIVRAEAQRRREIWLQTPRKLYKFTLEFRFVWRVLIDRIFMVFSVPKFGCVGNLIHCSKPSAFSAPPREELVHAETRRKFLCELCELCANKKSSRRVRRVRRVYRATLPQRRLGPITPIDHKLALFANSRRDRLQPALE